MSVSSRMSSVNDVSKRPVMPGRIQQGRLANLADGDRTVQIILRDLDKCKKVRKDRRRLIPKCEDLINFIVLQVRKRSSDHLLQATIVWALINILRFEPQAMRDIMVDAGVPGMMYEILSAEQLRGATRTYASELCFYVCSNEPYESKASLNRIKLAMDSASQGSSIETGSMNQFLPPNNVLRAKKGTSSKGTDASGSAIPRNGGGLEDDSLEYDGEYNRLRGDDMYSVGEDSLLSSVAGAESVADFVPYRIDSENMKKLNGLFEPKAVPGGQQLHDDVADLAYLFKTGESLQGGGDGDDNTIATESSWSSHTPQSKPASQHYEQAMYRSQQDPFGNAVFDGSTSMPNLHRSNSVVSEMSMDHLMPLGMGPSMMTSQDSATRLPLSRGGKAPSLMAASGFNASSSMSVAGSVSSKQGHSRQGTGTPKKHKGFVKGFNRSLEQRSVMSNLYDEVQPDIPLDLLKLDPLALNVNRSIQAIFDDESSTGDASSLQWSRSGPMEKSSDGTKRTRFAGETETFHDSYDGASAAGAEESKWRAEKLIDTDFLRALFSEHAKLQDSQELLKRLSDVLELVDTDKTGVIKWEIFSKVLLSISPPHILRADVAAFLDAQVDDPEDLIDYREFSISGKALIIEAEEKRGNPPINGWLLRQRKYTNDPSTYTWKNHMKWYRQRMSEAVVWLMRRAQRAIAQDALMLEAVRYLKIKGQKARATGWLFEQGFLALQKRASKKACYQRLRLRALHAKRTGFRREESERWLASSGMSAIHRKQQLDIDNETGEVIIEAAPEEPRVEQASYNMLYFLFRQQGEAFAWLKAVREKSVKHTAAQHDCFHYLFSYARQVIAQELAHHNASEWLKNTAEKAYQYGMVTDKAHLSLMRTGDLAYKYLCRQLEGLDWLRQRGARGVAHSSLQDEAFTGLSEHAQHSFALLNKREVAFEFIYRRRRECVILLERQAEAIQYLHRIAPSAVVQAVHNGHAVEWLRERAQRALAHSRRVFVAREKLKLVAGRYHWINRRERATQAELREIAQVAKLTNFTREWCSLPANKKRLLGEMQIIHKRDKEAKDARDAQVKKGEMTQEERWLVELHDAFIFLSKIMHVPKPKQLKKKKKNKDGEEVDSDEESDESSSDEESSDDDDDDDDDDNSEEADYSSEEEEIQMDKAKLAMIERARHEANTGLGKLGFKMLINGGKLLHIKRELLDEIYHEIDLHGVGVLSFTEIWHWFIIKARTVREIGHGLRFTMPDIVPTSERAKLVLIRRFAQQAAQQYLS